MLSDNPAREYRQRGKRAKRSRLGSAVAPVAFLRDPDAQHYLDGNPNRRPKVARANLNMGDPASAARERVTRNQGRRRRGEVCRLPYLETSWARIPALGSSLSKRPLKS